MSGDARRAGTRAVAGSLLAALFLTILPLPAWLMDYRPQWAALVVIFWTMYEPRRVGVFWGFGTGIALDVISGSVLGQNALALSVVAFLALELHQRVVAFPMPQQAFSVGLLLLTERLLSLWILGATGQPTPSLAYWLPVLAGVLLWPLLSAVLRAVREATMGDVAT